MVLYDGSLTNVLLMMVLQQMIIRFCYCSKGQYIAG